jgi:CDP-diacylglycerol--inositol 3-phosphatidyltransferase
MIMTPNEDIQQHGLAIGLYILSFAADLVDGWAARKFQQTSQFGGMLDMITDRCSTMGLLYVLGTQESDMSNQLVRLYNML